MVGAANDEKEAPKRNRVANNHVHACGARFLGRWGYGLASPSRRRSPTTSSTTCRTARLVWLGVGADPLGLQGQHDRVQPHLRCHEEAVRRRRHLHPRPAAGYRHSRQPDPRRLPRSQAQGAPNNGMFIDEGSTGFRFEGNVIYATGEQAVRTTPTRPRATLGWTTTSAWRCRHRV